MNKDFYSVKNKEKEVVDEEELPVYKLPVAKAPTSFNTDNDLLESMMHEHLKNMGGGGINALHAKIIAKDQAAMSLNRQLGSKVFEEMPTTTLGSGNDNIFPNASDD